MANMVKEYSEKATDACKIGGTVAAGQVYALLAIAAAIEGLAVEVDGIAGGAKMLAVEVGGLSK